MIINHFHPLVKEDEIIVSLVTRCSRHDLGEFKINFGTSHFYWVNKSEAYRLLNELESAIRQLSDEETNG